VHCADSAQEVGFGLLRKWDQSAVWRKSDGMKTCHSDIVPEMLGCCNDSAVIMEKYLESGDVAY
jgi:hypothetical protein